MQATTTNVTMIKYTVNVTVMYNISVLMRVAVCQLVVPSHRLTMDVGLSVSPARWRGTQSRDICVILFTPCTSFFGRLFIYLFRVFCFFLVLRDVGFSWNAERHSGLFRYDCVKRDFYLSLKLSLLFFTFKGGRRKTPLSILICLVGMSNLDHTSN